MDRKAAILRGINVGGHRRILMKDLKLLFEKLECKNVSTYIQSGNVIFESNHANLELENKIEASIKDTFGFDVPVIIRTSIELANSVHNNPFQVPNVDINKLHLTFLKETPTLDNVQHTLTYNFAPDKFKIDNKDVFVFCEGKYHQSKLTNNFFEKKLKTGATTRNWKTVLKLLELSND